MASNSAGYFRPPADESKISHQRLVRSTNVMTNVHSAFLTFNYNGLDILVQMSSRNVLISGFVWWYRRRPANGLYYRPNY